MITDDDQDLTLLRIHGVDLLDRIHLELTTGDALLALDRLFVELRTLRGVMKPEEWRRFAKETAIQHPLCKLLHQDPMISRSYEQPRGYAGDAELIDYIYRIRRPEAAPPRVEEIFDYFTTARPASLAVQNRRRVVARRLDGLLRAPRGLRRVLSVACGHLREGHLSRAFLGKQLDEVVALDADALSLECLERNFPDHQVTPVQASVTSLLRREEASFDFVYSSGLYDYLEDRLATKLTACLFERLRPGGHLLICNFLPQIFDAAFMESYMGWDLIYRSPSDFAALASTIDEDEVASRRVFCDSHDAVVYLEVEKRR